MKRMSHMLVVLAFAFMLALDASAQVRIYDTIYNAAGTDYELTELTLTGSLPRYRMADGLGVNLSVPHYLNRLDFVLVVANAGTFTNLSAEIAVYNAWDPNASGSVFSNLATLVTVPLDDVTTTGATAYIYQVTMPSGVVLDTNPNKGVVITLRRGGVLDNVLTLGVVNRLPNPGSEVVADLWYRDANDNGIIEASDARTFGGGREFDNVALTLWATPVPEPASLLVIGAGLAGLAGLRRRR